MDFDGDTIVVTGAGGGIGGEIARAFADHGGHVAVFDVDVDAGRETVAAIEEGDGSASFHEVDVTDADGVETAVDAVVDECGGVQVLVNNAGTGTYRPFLKTSQSDLDEVIDVNVRGVWNGCQAAIPHFRSQGTGAIVNVSSMAGTVGFPEYADYCLSKAAVLNLTRSLAAEFGPDGVRVNAVCPGTIDSQRIDDLFESRGYSVREREMAKRQFPLRRFGQPEEVADCVVFLASEYASFVTGHGLMVDGGKTASG